jgi:hypothetical protein
MNRALLGLLEMVIALAAILVPLIAVILYITEFDF